MARALDKADAMLTLSSVV